MVGVFTMNISFTPPIDDPNVDKSSLHIQGIHADEDMMEIMEVLGYVGADITAVETPGIKVTEYAFAIKDGNRRVIGYNKNALELANNILPYPEERWCSKWILAHEIGHHLLDHVNNKRLSRRAEELQADRFAGFVMRLLEADSAEAVFVVKNIIFDSDLDYPPTYDREEYILKGWNEAQEYINLLTNQELQLKL